MRIAIDAAELVATETMLAFPMEEVQAILGVFEGEIRIVEKETPEGVRQVLRVRKLFNQKYQENEIALTKESLSTQDKDEQKRGFRNRKRAGCG